MGDSDSDLKRETTGVATTTPCPKEGARMEGGLEVARDQRMRPWELIQQGIERRSDPLHLRVLGSGGLRGRGVLKKTRSVLLSLLPLSLMPVLSLSLMPVLSLSLMPLI